MKLIKSIIFSVMPFAVFSVFQSIAEDNFRDQNLMQTASAAALAAGTVIVAVQAVLRDRLCFPGVIAVTTAAITAAVYAIPAARYDSLMASSPVAHAVMKNPALAMYAALAVWSVMPQLLGFAPFTVYFAKMKTDSAFWGTRLFREINVLVSFFWGLLFLLCLLAQALPWNSARVAASIVIPRAIGVPITRKLVPYLHGRLSSGEERRRVSHIWPGCG